MIKNSKKHLRDAKENYLQHMGAALKISFQLFIASLQALFHSIIPAFFKTGASKKIRELHFYIEERKKK